MAEFIDSRNSGQSRILELNRPDHRNALTPEVLSELAEKLREADADPGVRAVILTGAGTVFCAGADLTLFAVERSEEEAADILRPFVVVFQTISELRTPLIAAVNGHALAGGFGLAMACDLVIAADTAAFGTPEIAIGLWPMMIMSIIKPQLGAKRAMELFLTGRRLTAAEALSWGIANEVVPAGSVVERSLEIAASLERWSPDILGRGRFAFHAIDDLSFSEALSYLHGEISAIASGKDSVEGARAFLEHRQPSFSSLSKRSPHA